MVYKGEEEAEDSKHVLSGGEEIERAITYYCRHFDLNYGPLFTWVYGVVAFVFQNQLKDRDGAAQILGRFHAVISWLMPYLLFPQDMRDLYVQQVGLIYPIIYRGITMCLSS